MDDETNGRRVMNGLDSGSSSKPVGVDRGQPRYLPDLKDVERLLDIRSRPWPDGELTVSFAARAIWACGKSPNEFSEWWRGTSMRLFALRGLLREGVDYITIDGEPYLDVFDGRFIAVSTVPQVREAARLIAEAARRVQVAACASGARLPRALREELDAAERRAASLPSDGRVPVRMHDGTSRYPVDVDGVADALKLAERRFGSTLVLSVSARGAWSCTAARRLFDDWFRASVLGEGLVAGQDFVGDLKADGDVFVDARHVRLMLRTFQADAARAAIALTEQALRNARPSAELGSLKRLDVAAKRSAAATPKAAEAGPAASQDPDGTDEPWAEAFDFGRIVPVVEREIGGVLQPTVSARDVHIFLGVGRQFSKWVDEQIARCGLVEGVDYVAEVLVKNGENPLGGRPSRECFLTLAAAKSVAVASSGPRGKAVRAYFIECERRLLAGEPPIPGSVGSDHSPAVAVAGLPDGEPLFMCLGTYLVARGFSERVARREAAAAGRGVAVGAIAAGGAAGVRLAPGGAWEFVVALLDRWWVANRTRLLASLAGRSALPRSSSGTGS
jgi:phage anti-repressor protein